MSQPTVSVIINTNARRLSLGQVIEALKWQRYPAFELCLVVGPAEDGSAEFVRALDAAGHAKAGFCLERNLSMSRNIGLDLAAGDLVAFLDDDALPEPVWLEQLTAAFTRPEIAAASGLVFQPNSRDIQFRYSLCDRFGETIHLDAPAQDAAYPLSPEFPHVMGANCMFRRDALIAAGGFDEEYEYYLEEADICCRLVDAGHHVVHADGAPVHHKYLSGATRDGAGITVRRGSIIKNQLYFSLKNARRHAEMREIIDQARAFMDWHWDDLDGHVHEGRLPEVVLADFDRDADAAWEAGLTRGLSAERRLRGGFADAPVFRPFPRRGEGRHIAVTAAPDGATAVGGMDDMVRYFELAEDAAAEGVIFDDGAWRWRVWPEGELGASGDPANAIRRARDRIAQFHPFDDVIDHLDGGT